VYQELDIEKISAYECGFQPFEDSRTKFNVRYYLISILFIIFDLEIMYLFP
jgi:NADH-quinone oxidoreductase subunit A